MKAGNLHEVVIEQCLFRLADSAMPLEAPVGIQIPQGPSTLDTLVVIRDSAFDSTIGFEQHSRLQAERDTASPEQLDSS